MLAIKDTGHFYYRARRRWHFEVISRIYHTLKMSFKYRIKSEQSVQPGLKLQNKSSLLFSSAMLSLHWGLQRRKEWVRPPRDILTRIAWWIPRHILIIRPTTDDRILLSRYIAAMAALAAGMSASRVCLAPLIPHTRATSSLGHIV